MSTPGFANESTENELLSIEAALRMMLTRFRPSNGGLVMGDGDEAKYKQAGLELRDLAQGLWPESTYPSEILSTVNSGWSDYYSTFSYNGVEALLAVIGAMKTRLQRDSLKKFASNNPDTTTQSEPLKYPERVTWAWLKTNVPMKFWTGALSILAATFFAGIAAGQNGFVKDIATHFSLVKEATSAANPAQSTASGPVTKPPANP